MPEYVYIMRGGGYIKVGKSKDIVNRLRHFNRGHVPFRMDLVCYAEFSNDANSFHVESYLLQMFPDKTIGEWFLDNDQPESHFLEAMRLSTKRLGLRRAPIVSKSFLVDGKPYCGTLSNRASGRAVAIFEGIEAIDQIGKNRAGQKDNSKLLEIT